MHSSHTWLMATILDGSAIKKSWEAWWQKLGWLESQSLGNGPGLLFPITHLLASSFHLLPLFSMTTNGEDKASAMPHHLGQEQLEEVVGVDGFGIPQPVYLDKESREAARWHIAHQRLLRPTRGWILILLHGYQYTHAHTPPHICTSVLPRSMT